MYGMCIEELISEQAFQIVPSLRYAFGAEDNPANDGKEERQSHLTKLPDVWQIASIGYHVLVFRVDAENVVYGKQCCLVQSPADKRPVGSVPQTADAPDDIDVADDFPFVASAAA